MKVHITRRFAARTTLILALLSALPGASAAEPVDPQPFQKQPLDHVTLALDRKVLNPVRAGQATGKLTLTGVYADGSQRVIPPAAAAITARTKQASGNVEVVVVEGDKVAAKEGGVATLEATVVDGGKTYKAATDVVVTPYYRDYHQTLVMKLFLGMEGDPVERLANDPTFREGHEVMCTFEEALEVIRKTDNLTRGIPKIIYLVGWQKGGHDHGYPAWSEVNPKMKRAQDTTALDSLRWLIREARQFNTTVSLHINMLDAYQQSPLFDEYVAKDCFAKDENGKLLAAGIQVKGEDMYNVVYPKEWEAGLAQRRIDGLIQMIPELKEGHTIHVDVFIAQRDGKPISPWHARPENGGLTADKYVDTQRKIFHYWRDRGFDVTGEGTGWAHPPGEHFIGLQPMSWWYSWNPMEIPECLGARGRTDRGGDGDFRFGSSMQGEEIWKQDKANMPGFLGQFCRTTLPWYFLSRFERQKFENEAVYYSDGVVALTENGKRIIRKGDFVLREDDHLFVPALWNGKEIIAYSRPGYENKAWRMPDDWNEVKSVDFYQITLEGCAPMKKNVPVTDGKLVLSLANDQAVSIVPAGTRLAGRVVASLAADSLPGLETKEQRDARMAWWRDARFGMFIHWGLYAIPAQGEWYMNNKVPVAEYAQYAAQFNPVKFDARLWVRIAKEAGMKYMVLTAKHHDGFAMFATAASRFNIVDATPFKRDVVKELSQACRDAGLKFGVYYSNGQDWHHPGGGKLKQWDPVQAGDEDQFIKTIVVPQVHELLHNYGLLDLFWWDSSVDLWSPQHPNRAARLYEEFKPFPKLLINNRLYDCYRNLQFKPEFWKTSDPLERFIRGDYATPETEFPGSVPEGIDWETCDSAGGGWGYVKGGQAKPVADLVHNLIDVTSKGGNYLLNVGPDAEGVIPPTHVDSLRGVGNWLRVNGEAIYGTSASRLPSVPWGRITRKPGKLYLHVFAWPADGTLRVPLQDKVRSAVLLAEPQRQLPIQQTDKELVITLPADAPDRIASVLVLD